MSKIPKNKLNPKLKNDAASKVAAELQRISSREAADKFLDTFFTDGEKDHILRRIGAMILLSNGKKYRDIKEELQISSNTLSYVRDIMLGRGYGRNPERHKVRAARPAVPKKSRRLFPKYYKGAKSII